MIRLTPAFAARLPRPWTAVADAFAVEGEIYREPPGANRRTLRFELAGDGYFLKLHWGVGWREIFKNLLSGRLPVLGACNEWRAIQALETAGVPVPTLAAWGREGWNPARRRSFVVTGELAGCLSLEEHCADWARHPPPPAHKRALIDQVAAMTRRLHQAGLNHRDLYLCHFLLRRESIQAPPPQLYLIDLHRVQRRRRVPLRWRAKDLGALWFSALEIGLTRRDLLRFFRTYAGEPLRPALRRHRRLLQASRRRMLALARKGIPDE